MAQGAIPRGKADFDLFQWGETAEEAWACISDFYELKDHSALDD